MSLRRAIISQLKNQVAALSGRVYQAFLAPVTVQPPYAAIKLAAERQAVNNTFAGSQSVEVYIYRALDTYVSLDALRQEVIKALNGVVLTDFESNARYVVRWIGSAGDVIDAERKLLGVVVSFEAAVIHERR